MSNAQHHLLYWHSGFIYSSSVCAPVMTGKDTVVSCPKTAEPFEMLFGLRTQIGPRKHVLGGLHTDATCEYY